MPCHAMHYAVLKHRLKNASLKTPIPTPQKPSGQIVCIESAKWRGTPVPNPLTRVVLFTASANPVSKYHQVGARGTYKSNAAGDDEAHGRARQVRCGALEGRGGFGGHGARGLRGAGAGGGNGGGGCAVYEGVLGRGCGGEGEGEDGELHFGWLVGWFGWWDWVIVR